MKTVHDLSKFWRIVISVIALIISGMLFYFPYKKELKIVTVDGFVETTYHYYTLIEYGAQLLGTACLILIVWLWKRELGIKNFGGIESDSIEKDVQPILPDDGREATNPNNEVIQYSTIGRISIGRTDTELNKQILSFIKDRHYVGANRIASEFKISVSTARSILHNLVDSNQLAFSSYKGGMTYIDPDFHENKAIDWLVGRLKNQFPDLDRVYKFVRFSGVEYDAIAESSDQVLFIEIVKKGTNTIGKFRRFKEQAIKSGFRYGNKKCTWVFGIIVPDGQGYGSDLFDPDYISITTIDIPESKL